MSSEHTRNPRPPEWNGNPCYAFGKMPDTPAAIFDLPGLNYYCRNPIVNTLLFGEISPRILWNLKETNAIQSFWNSFPYNSPNYWPIWNIKRCARKALSRLSRLFIGFQVLSKICSFALLFTFLNAGTWSSGTKLFLDHVCPSPSAASISSPHMGDLPCTSAAISRFGTSRNICRIL